MTWRNPDDRLYDQLLESHGGPPAPGGGGLGHNPLQRFAKIGRLSQQPNSGLTRPNLVPGFMSAVYRSGI